MSALQFLLRPDWPERLAAYIESRRFAPFEWGRNDCALFMADGVFEMTGTDGAAQWRGYATEKQALKLIRKTGGLRGFLGELREVPPKLGQRGHVSLAELEGRETLGLIAGNGYWCAPGADGLIFRPQSEIVAAFGF